MGGGGGVGGGGGGGGGLAQCESCTRSVGLRLEGGGGGGVTQMERCYGGGGPRAGGGGVGKTTVRNPTPVKQSGFRFFLEKKKNKKKHRYSAQQIHQSVSMIQTSTINNEFE